MTTPLPRPIPPPAGEPLQASDAELAARAAAGDRGAFELIMRRHNRRLFRLARSLVRSDEEAEDVLQEAYLRAFARLSDLAENCDRLERPRYGRYATQPAISDESGVVMLPPMPAFYNHPQTVEEVVDHIVFRVLDQFGIAAPFAKRWDGHMQTAATIAAVGGGAAKSGT